MKKKLVAVIMTVLMVLTMVEPAFAIELGKETEAPEIIIPVEEIQQQPVAEEQTMEPEKPQEEESLEGE